MRLTKLPTRKYRWSCSRSASVMVPLRFRSASLLILRTAAALNFHFRTDLATSGLRSPRLAAMTSERMSDSVVFVELAMSEFYDRSIHWWSDRNLVSLHRWLDVYSKFPCRDNGSWGVLPACPFGNNPLARTRS